MGFWGNAVLLAEYGSKRRCVKVVIHHRMGKLVGFVGYHCQSNLFFHEAGNQIGNARIGPGDNRPVVMVVGEEIIQAGFDDR